MLFLAAALALLIGLSLGLLGGGGSILTLPILVYVLDAEPAQAIASSLLVVAGQDRQHLPGAHAMAEAASARRSSDRTGLRERALAGFVFSDRDAWRR